MGMAQDWCELDWYFEPDPISLEQLVIEGSMYLFGAGAVCALLAHGVAYSQYNACLRRDWLTFSYYDFCISP